MHFRTYISLIALILLCSSCSRVIFGMKQPRVENRQSIINTAKNWEMDIDKLYLFDRDTTFPEPHPEQLRYNQFRLYNNNRAEIKNPIRCHTGLFYVMKNIDKNSLDSLKRLEPQDSAFYESHSKLLHHTSPHSNANTQLKNETAYDFYAFYYWTKSLPRFTKRDLKLIEEIMENEEMRIKLYIVNLDLLDEWYTEPEKVLNQKVRVRVQLSL